MSLETSRDAVLAAAAAAGCTPHKRAPRIPRAGDTWVSLESLSPTGFGSATVADWNILICLGSDEAAAEQRLDRDAIDIINTIADVPDIFDVSAAPSYGTVGSNSGTVYMLVVNASMEVDNA